MSSPATLLATAKIRPGSESAFVQWQTRLMGRIAKFPEFVGTDVLPPPPERPRDAWTLILNFASEEALAAWQQSPERAAAIAEVAPLLDGGNLGEMISQDRGKAPNAVVTEVIFSKVKTGMADRYREWAARIQTAQARYPGYRGMYLQPPAGDGGHWTSILRYDSTEHLEAWMNAPERKVLLEETAEFIESEELMRLQTSFPGWVPLDPLTGDPPPNWKAALLVLLGLFPIVMLEMKFLGIFLDPLGVKNASLATFIGNSISVALTSFAAMPLFVRWFGWWLFPKGDKRAQTAKGVAILCGLFAVEVLVLWNLMG